MHITKTVLVNTKKYIEYNNPENSGKRSSIAAVSRKAAINAIIGTPIHHTSNMKNPYSIGL